MNICKKCGAALVQLFTSLVCSQECDLKPSVPILDFLDKGIEDPYKTYRVNHSYNKYLWIKTSIKSVKFVDCDFRRGRFIDTDIDTCRFEGCSFKDATFENCSLSGCVFVNCKDLIIPAGQIRP